MNKYATTGYRVAQIRANENITQAEFAKKLGISRPALSAIENGVTKISIPIAYTIEHLFGYDFVWIMTGDGVMKPENVRKLTLKEPSGEELPPIISPWDKELLDACFTLKKIFDDKVHKKAIIENLHAFDLSIDDRKAKEELNKKLQESLQENEGVQNRISNLEKLCADIPDMKNKFESLQSENRALRTENNRLKSTYEAPHGDDGSVTAVTEKKAI
jgi:transcriptional regulator with XRE-family HTH domain